MFGGWKYIFFKDQKFSYTAEEIIYTSNVEKICSFKDEVMYIFQTDVVINSIECLKYSRYALRGVLKKVVRALWDFFLIVS